MKGNLGDGVEKMKHATWICDLLQDKCECRHLRGLNFSQEKTKV